MVRIGRDIKQAPLPRRTEINEADFDGSLGVSPSVTLVGVELHCQLKNFEVEVAVVGIWIDGCSGVGSR